MNKAGAAVLEHVVGAANGTVEQSADEEEPFGVFDGLVPVGKFGVGQTAVHRHVGEFAEAAAYLEPDNFVYLQNKSIKHTKQIVLGFTRLGAFDKSFQRLHCPLGERTLAHYSANGRILLAISSRYAISAISPLA